MANFKRIDIMRIAKIIRNIDGITDTRRGLIIKDFADLFRKDNPLFDEKTFRSICIGKLEKDPRTYHHEK